MYTKRNLYINSPHDTHTHQKRPKYTPKQTSGLSKRDIYVQRRKLYINSPHDTHTHQKSPIYTPKHTSGLSERDLHVHRKKAVF